MKREVLIDLTERIESEIKIDDAYLGAFYVDHESDRFIKANKNGMLKFIILLLNSLKDFDFHLEKEDHFAIINLKKEQLFDKESTIAIDWIEPTKKSRDEIIRNDKENKNKKESFFNNIITGIIGYSILTFIVVSFLVGVFMVLKWLFQSIF